MRQNRLSFARIARDKKMNESSIRTIWKNKNIKRQGFQTAKFDAKTIVWKKRLCQTVENNAKSFQISKVQTD